MKNKMSLTAKGILNRKNNARSIVIPDLKLYYRAIVTTVAGYITQKGM